MKKFISLILVTVIFASAGCTKKSEKSLQKVTIALNWVPEPEFGGFYAAKLNKIYEKYGLDVDLLVGGAGTPTIQMVAAGKVDFGVTSGGEVIVSRAHGADVVAVYAVYQKSPLMIMAHQSRGLKSIADVFKSGTLAVERGQAFITYLEKKYGFSNVKVVPYAGGVSAFLHDPLFSQQGFATSEPLLAKRQGSDPEVFLVADVGFNPYLETLTTRGELLRSDEKLVKAVVEGTREGWELYLKNPDETNKLMASLNKIMDLETFKEGAKAQMSFVEDDFTRKNKLGLMTESRWKEQAEQLRDLKVVSTIFPATEYFRNF
ncbi:MAG: transport system substrate-binding protein [Bacteriovoracaceae bacterium]|nr:transport system substrate-binding protein [Bacteriovoracaceae bacterium]